MLALPYVRSWGFGPATATGGTAFTQLLPPFSNIPPLAYAQQQGSGLKPNWFTGGSLITRVNTLLYTTGATAHKVGLLTPLNFCYLTAAAAAAQAVVNINADPGNYALNYLYPTAGGNPPSTANNLLSAGDYVAYQSISGVWYSDIVASVSGLAITLTNNLPTGGLVQGQPLFDFGIIGDLDPATNLTRPQVTTVASTAQAKYQDINNGIWSALHPGDPLIFYSPNTTAAGVMDMISGCYAGNA